MICKAHMERFTRGEVIPKALRNCDFSLSINLRFEFNGYSLFLHGGCIRLPVPEGSDQAYTCFSLHLHT